MSSQPTISVIIPTFNGSQFISETIDSILAQDFNDFEIIVIDDESSDATPDIVSKYKSPVRLITQTNSGVCVARNRGIREAKGSFIAFLDQDDYWFPNKLSSELAAFSTYLDAGVVFAKFHRWTPDMDTGHYPSPLTFSKLSKPDGEDPDFTGWIYHQMLLDSQVLTSAALARVDIFKKCGAFDESLPFSEDWEFWLRVSRQFQFVKLRQITVLYRQHPTQGSRWIRPVDYATKLIEHAVSQYGLTSPDGKCVDQKALSQRLALLSFWHGQGHLYYGDIDIAKTSLKKAWLTQPLSLRYLVYFIMSAIGIRPKIPDKSPIT
jgi:glycosyltransferase involved in cell wall biosynthesis